MKKIIITSISLLFSLNFSAQIITTSKANVALYKKTSGNYYRVTAKGFICNRETVDDMLERDGKRDEIYLTSSAVLINSGGVSIPSTAIKLRSRTFGDVNARDPQEKRAMAGSAVGNLGGIQTGDQVPDVEPWKNNASAKGDLLPFILWEGDLSGGKSVLISPSIMEWDGPADFLTTFWHDSFVGHILNGPVALASIPFKMFTGTGINDPFNLGSYDDSTPGVFPPPTVVQQFQNFYKVNYEEFAPQDKQKFINANSVDAGRPNDRPIGMNNGMYNPLNIKLDASSFDRIANTDFGYGIGIIPLKFKDSSGLSGDYTVFYSFEIVTDNAQKNKINVNNPDAFNPSVAYKFRNAYALDFTTDLLGGGDIVVMNDDKNLQSEKWYIRKADQYYYHFINPYNNQKLGFQFNGDTQPLVAKTNGQGEGMAFIRYCDGSWIIKLSGDRKGVLQTDNLNIQLGTPVNFIPYFGGKNQRWFIEQ